MSNFVFGMQFAAGMLAVSAAFLLVCLGALYAFMKLTSVKHPSP